MGMTDPISDMLTRIRNATTRGHEKVDIPSSKIKIEIAKILKQEGFIKNYKFIADRKQGILRIYFKYSENKERVITDLRRVSKPGCRIYVKNDEIPSVLSGLGIAILSTSNGVMTGRLAKKLGVGGEVICYVW
ncbi:MAG: 30S ribosomal protein S8 [bacterium]|nr:30S ribosomal protein S8 [bacterium]